MTEKSSILLDMEVKRGMIPSDKAEGLRETLASVDSPLEWLLDNQHLSASQANDLRKGAMALLREDDLSGGPPEPAPLPPPKPGSKIGAYQLIKQLGSGGMGIVYLAHDPRLDRSVAIKILHRAEKPEIRARFAREAKAMAKLKHPRIANIFDVGEDQQRPYLVMEMYKGMSLAEAMEKEKLSRRDIIDVIRQAAIGVSFANKNGVFHRDLKPANILVTERKEGIVMDFGLAKLSETEEQTLSLEGSVLGTPAYMSPEQATGNLEKVDRRTDVWGLGATLFHALTGEPPFPAATVHEVIKSIVEKEPPSLRKKDPSIHADLETITLKSLEKNPEDRYPSATDFAKDLRHFLSGEPILASPPSTIHLAKKWFFRKRRILVAIAGGLILALIFTFASMEISKSRRFDRLKAEAIAAQKDGHWSEAVAKSDEAMQIRPDEDLRKLRTTSLEEITREKELQKRQTETISKQAQLDALRKKIQPLEEQIREARSHFYAKDVDIAEKLLGVEKSLQELEELLQNDEFREYALGWKTIGLGWYFVGDPVRAERGLLVAQRLDPDDGGVSHPLGKIHLQRALEALRTREIRSLSDRKELSERWARKASDLLEKNSTRVEGKGDFDRLLADAHLARAKGNVAELERICGEGLSKFRDRLGAEEFHFLLGTAKQGSDARSKFTEVIRRVPNHSRAYYERGMNWAREGAFKQALEDLDTSIRINRRSVWAHIGRGLLHTRSGKTGPAIDDFSKVIHLLALQEPLYDLMEKPRYEKVLAGRIHRERGNLFLQVGTLEKALTGLNKAIDLNGKDPIAHTDRGRAYRRMKKFPAALADFEEALKIDPDYPDAYYERSLLRLTEGNFPGARSDWHKILEIDRKFWQVHLLQGMNSLGRGKWSEGTTQLKKGLRLVSMLPPSGSVTRRNNTRTKRSNMKSMMGDPRIEARELYEEGIRLSTRGKYDEALEALTEAIRIRPDYSQAYMRRGNIRRKQREWTDALEDYRRVLSLTKDSGRNTEKLEAIIRDLERRVENR